MPASPRCCSSRWRITTRPSRWPLSIDASIGWRVVSIACSTTCRCASAAPWLELIEEHIKGLAGHFEATSRQLARLDAVDEQLRQLARALEEHVHWSRAQPVGLRDDAIAAMIDTAAERAASRLAAALPAPATPAPEAEGSKRIDTLEALLQDYIGERRRGEEAASSMLHTIEETLIRILDRVDAMEAAGATPYAPTDGNAPGQDGMDAESDRLAEAYASGARILGQKPSQPMLDAADYAPLLARQEKSPEPAAGGLDDATAEAIQTRHEPSAFAMRAKLKAQAAPEAPTSASPATDDTKADTGKRENAKASARARGSWSNLLFGGAMLVLFGIGYLAVDLFVAPGVAPALQQNSVAPTVEGQPATDSTQLKAEQGTADPQPGPQTGKSEAATPSPDDKEEPVQVPVPQPAKRPTRDTLTDDLGQGEPPRHLAAISTQALPGTVLQDIPLAANDGAAPPGIDAMPPPGVGTAALRNAAANGDALAQLEVAARFAEGNGVAQDHKLAFAWYERAAMHGLAPAQFRLAAYYERGVGVAVDAERAKIWYRRAAEQGHVRAMHNLAVLVVGNGKDDADYAAAAHWFQQAADRGLTDSQFNLAVLYAHGRGVAKDLAEAYKWFALAARSGDAGAARKLEEMKAQLELPEREAAEQKARCLAREAGRASRQLRRPVARYWLEPAPRRQRTDAGLAHSAPFCAANLPACLHFLGTWCPYRPRENSRPQGGSPGAGGAIADSPDWPFLAGAGLTTDAIPAGSDLDLMLSCTRRAHAVAMPEASVRRSGQTAWCGMHFYLPVAEMSANVFIFLAMGGAVGFLSGLFGVGGGFLMTPLLIFSGIPPAVAVGTESAQIVASSVSGAFAQWRRKQHRLHDGRGAAGRRHRRLRRSACSWSAVLRRLGLFDFFVAACYVTFLGVIGTLMLIESVNTMRKTRAGDGASARRSGQHNWIHGLPFKMRFQRSKLYISAIPPLADRPVRRPAGGHHGRRRRLHHGAGHDLSAARADQRRGRHLAVPDRVPDRGDDRAACLAEPDRRRGAGRAADGRRRDRCAVRRGGRRAAEGRAAALPAGGAGAAGRPALRLAADRAAVRSLFAQPGVGGA